MNKTLIAALAVTACSLIASTVVATSSLPPPPNIRVTYYPNLNNEEQVFICPTDSNIVLANWRDFRLGYRQIGVGKSTDGGLTWTDSLISVDMQYFADSAWQSDPTMTVDRYGNYYMSVLDYDSDQRDGSMISFYKSVDQGVSWMGPVTHIPEVYDPTVFEDKQFITADRTGGPYDGNIYCAWARYPDPIRIMFIRSTDGCYSFEDTVVIGPPQNVPSCGVVDVWAGQYANPMVSANGNVHVFWFGYYIDPVQCTWIGYLKQRTSSDGGQTFGPEELITTASGQTEANGGIATYSMPVGDADITDGPFDGNMYIVYTNWGYEDLTYHTDIDFVRSTDNGQTWSEKYQINDAENSSDMDAFHPWLVVNQEGILVVVFYDQRYDPDKYSKFDCIAAYSFDGGQTFTTNHRVSSVSSRPQDLMLLASQDTPSPASATLESESAIESVSSMAGLIAEYIGVSAYYDKVLAMWTDARDNDQEVYTATWDLPLLEPRLEYPDDLSSHEAPPELGWATSWKNNIDRYRVELSPFDDFSSDVQSTVTDTNFYQPSSSLPTGTWYWRVKVFDITTGDSSDYSPVHSFYSSSAMLCGDVNGSGLVDILDTDYLLAYFFRGGDPPVSMSAANMDGNDRVDILDIDYMLAWMLRSGPALNCQPL